MNAIHLLSRLAAPTCLLLLAACQTVPTKTESATQQPLAAEQAQQSPTTAPGAAQAQEQGVPVVVALADVVQHEGWISVALNEGSVLYLNPEPILTRNGLIGVQAGSSSNGEGLLALELGAEAAEQIKRVTSANPNRRLALIVGRTLMAAPGYAEPVVTQQLVFSVGTEENATAAARAIAGADAVRAPAKN